MRAYSVAISSLALDAPLKWTDNTISQHAVHGVVSAQRGVARRISFPALLILAVARELQVELHLSTSAALAVAHQLTQPGGESGIRHGAIHLSVDVAAVRHRLEQRLADAMESAPAPRRGRPPGT